MSGAMSDIVERLRDVVRGINENDFVPRGTIEAIDEGADEIERLRGELEEFRIANDRLRRLVQLHESDCEASD